jgi:hypothetical protein
MSRSRCLPPKAARRARRNHIPELDDQQQPMRGVLLLDERGSRTRADRVSADASVSSNPGAQKSAADALARA